MKYKEIVEYLNTVDLDKPIAIKGHGRIYDPLMYVEIMKSHVDNVEPSKRLFNAGSRAAKANLKLIVDYYKKKENG